MASGTRMRVEDPDKLINDGKNLVDFSDDYLIAVTRIYQIADELNSSSWKGIKADSYIEDIRKYEQPLKDLSTLMTNMGNGINSAGKALYEFENS